MFVLLGMTWYIIELYRVSQKKVERSIFDTYGNIAYFSFIRLNIDFRKGWYQDHLNWLSSFDSMVHVISQNTVIVNFLSILVTFSGWDNDFWLHTLLPGRPLIGANKTKRELLDGNTRRK